MIHIICALKCEAVPLVARFELEQDRAAVLFKTFVNHSNHITLTICGIGKLAACAGTMHAIKHFNSVAGDSWLNIGIAGHKSLPLGQLVLADRIQDESTGIIWHPRINFACALPAAGLITLDQPSAAYRDLMFDMEAAGFYFAASRTTGKGLIHCLKIISDNPENPSCRINKSKICRLIAGQTEQIASFITSLNPQGLKPETGTGR
jgi:nucleoside phosphorylase